MSTEETIRKTLQRTMLEALSDSRVQTLLSGDMAPGDLREFFRNFIVTHLNSVQILSFLFAVAPREPSDLVKGNLLEEMGESGGVFSRGRYATRNITEEGKSVRTTSTRCLHRDRCEVSQRLVLGPFPTLRLHCHCSGFLTACWILDAAKVSEHVASHTRERPDFQGTMVTPSGHFPSSRQRPLGSSADGI